MANGNKIAIGFSAGAGTKIIDRSTGLKNTYLKNRITIVGPVVGTMTWQK